MKNSPLDGFKPVEDNPNRHRMKNLFAIASSLGLIATIACSLNRAVEYIGSSLNDQAASASAAELTSPTSDKCSGRPPRNPDQVIKGSGAPARLEFYKETDENGGEALGPMCVWVVLRGNDGKEVPVQIFQKDSVSGEIIDSEDKNLSKFGGPFAVDEARIETFTFEIGDDNKWSVTIVAEPDSITEVHPLAPVELEQQPAA